MKKCAYCGRENDDAAAHCRECGTEFVVAALDTQPAAPRDRTWLEWLRYVLRYGATVFFIGLIYLLSFGPVAHYCGTVTSVTLAPTVYTTNGQTVTATMVRRVSYPRWVGMIYSPAMVVRSAEGGMGPYGRYLQWWDSP